VVSVVTTIVQEPTEKTIATMIAERAERGRQFWLTSRQLMTKTGADTYEVPSCSTDERYTVQYGGALESCTCTDYGVHRGEIACKHLTAVGIMHAARRSGVREIRLMAAACGDPFSYAAKRDVCSGCGRRFRHQELVEYVEDNHDELTYFDGDLLCPACADNAGVERT
jgi:hypothetical protein